MKKPSLPQCPQCGAHGLKAIIPGHAEHCHDCSGNPDNMYSEIVIERDGGPDVGWCGDTVGFYSTGAAREWLKKWSAPGREFRIARYVRVEVFNDEDPGDRFSGQRGLGNEE